MLLGEGLWKVYGAAPVLRGVTIQVAPRETTALVGETGSGKSTIARILCGLTRADRGAVSLAGNPVPRKAALLRAFRKQVQMVFQDASGSLDPRMTAEDILSEPLRNYTPARGAEMREQAERLLEEVGLDRSLGRRYPHELSGGQRQRVVIARALAPDPDYLVCDEPLSGLDEQTQDRVVRALTRLGRDRGVLFISHDLSRSVQISRRLYVLFAGAVVEHLPAERVGKAAHPYTRALFQGLYGAEEPVPEVRAKTGADFGIAETGCPFRLQCAEARLSCRGEPPVRLVCSSRNHWARCYAVRGESALC